MADNLYDNKNSASDFDESDYREYKNVSIIAYIFFGFIITLSVARHSRYATFHANQACVLFIFEIIALVALGVVIALVSLVAPGLMMVFGPIFSAIYWIFTLVMMFTGISNAKNGREKELPVIGKITIIAPMW